MVVGRHLPVGRFILEGPARGGRTTDGAGRRDRRTRECPGAGEGGCGGGAPWARGQRGGMRSPLGLFGLDGKSRVGNLIDVGEQPFEPKGADFLLWGLVSLGMGGGTLPSPAQDFKRQSHDRSRGSTCSSQVQGQSARIKAGLGTASLAPRPSPLAPCRQLATRPRLPAQRPSAGCWWQSHMSREWSWSGR